MISKFKVFESKKDIILYKNEDFSILINSNNSFTFESKTTSMSGILAMAKLINLSQQKEEFVQFIVKSTNYLNDQNLRNVNLPKKAIEEEIYYLTLTEIKTNNIKYYKTSAINGFLNYNPKREDKDIIKLNLSINNIKEIPINAYMELTFKYYPLILNAVKNSKTLGDIIDKFKIIYIDLIEDLPIYVNMSNYNL